MKKKIIISAIIIVCLGILAAIIFIKKTPESITQTCISAFDIDHYTGMTGAITLDKIRAQELFHATALANSKELIGTDSAGNIVVNEKYFSTLAKTDATRVTGPTNIGTYKQLSFTDYSPRDIVEFLLTSQLITTYRHLNSHVCLVQETDTENFYKANFAATHEYCTNECITQEYAFSLQIDKQNGTITLGL